MSRVLVILLLLSPLNTFAESLRGVVRGPDGQPLAGAAVALDEQQSIATPADGRFAFDVAVGTHRVRVSRDGFQPQTLEVVAPSDVSVALKAMLRETMVVSSIRASAETPVTKTDLTRADIRKNYYGQDIPFLLRETPSINAYAEGGVGGAGYSYITLRGISPTRLNFTFDGVPLADSEDMATYFVDLPDLAHSLESIQVQRGVGTSTVGSPSFGGSVNLESVALSSTPSTEGWIGAGSFGTRLGSIAMQSGSLPSGFAAYGRVSMQETNGFREHSGVGQRSVFLSAAKQGEESQLKFTGFAGHESQHESFLAADEATLRSDLRFNPLSANDRDSFGYNLAEVQYMRSNITGSLFLQRGYGWYSLGGSRYGLDGLLVGGMLSGNTTWRGVTANYGVHLNHFRREHTGPDYFNYGTKGEANGFAKFSWDTNRWRIYLDAQLRSTDFRYHGDVRIDPIRWTLFNPKLGARYELSARSGIFASAGVSRREPARIDLFQGEDNATIPHDLHAVRPERLFDLEAGWDFRTPRGLIATNIYSMSFHDEIAATGELSELGLPLRRNVDRSYRRGIELEERWQATQSVLTHGSASVSRNRIHTWTQFGATYRDVHPLVTPQVIVNQSIDYIPARRVTLTATGRYVAKSYLDNTNNDALTLPSFFSLDGALSVRIHDAARLTLQLNNALNNKRIFASGYTDGAVRYFYPQATRNFVLMMDVGERASRPLRPGVSPDREFRTARRRAIAGETPALP